MTTGSGGTRTYLKSYEVDAQGRRFEIALDGNFVGQFNDGNLLFDAAPVPSYLGDAEHDETSHDTQLPSS